MYGNQHKLIGWMVIAIVSYYVLQVVLPLLVPTQSEMGEHSTAELGVGS